MSEQVEERNAQHLAAVPDLRRDQVDSWENLDSIHLRKCRVLEGTRYPLLVQTWTCVHVLICVSSDDDVLWVGYGRTGSLHSMRH